VGVVLAVALSACSLLSPLQPERLSDVPSPPPPGAGVALRQLVVATDPADVGLATWRAVLDGIGTPYDVVFAATSQINANTLVRPDGVGRYNGVLLTSSALWLPEGGGGAYRSALTPESWQALWDYERVFAVRQVALSASPGETPEDYCLRASTEASIGKEPVIATLAPAGEQVFDRLKPGAPIPIANAYAYRTTIAAGCDAQPLLTIGSDVVGVLSRAADGRERLAITIALPEGQIAIDLLAYGLVRWATHGVFLGEQRNSLAVDVDDWFLPTLRTQTNGVVDAFRLTGPEAQSTADQQDALRKRHPLASDFTLTLAFNASTLLPTAPVQCDGSGTSDPLSSYTLCLVDKFRWINHTFSHPELTTTSYAESRSQIADNLARADLAGIPVPKDILKTPEYSGLGFFPDTPTSEPTDHGLGSANEEMLRAARDLGVRYLHGNMSFPSHRPSCFNCATALPLQPGLTIVPDWPTNISYEATTPDEATADYNATYGIRGTSPDKLGRDLDYPGVIDAEADIALGHIVSGSAYVHTFHQGNLHEYAPGRTLTFDWLEATLSRYDRYYSTPLQNPDWPTLTTNVTDRSSHFAGLKAGDDAVWNRVEGSVTVDPKVSGTLFITGLSASGSGQPSNPGADSAERIGSDTVSRVRLEAGRATSFEAPATAG
jgi:hypothetical protein